MPRIRSCAPMDIDRWRTLDRRNAAPVFTARPAWSFAWAESFNSQEPWPIEVVFDDGRTTYVPLLSSRSRLGWRACSGLPWGEATMFLDDQNREASSELATQAAKAIANQCCHALELTLWPMGELTDLPLLGQRVSGEVSAIDLAQGFSAAIDGMNGKARRMAGQAERRGVTCAIASGDDAIATYYDMLESSAKRWGLAHPTISPELLRNVFKYAGPDAEIWFAYFEGKPIAGGAVLYGSQEMYFWSAAMYAEFGPLRPSNALNVALMRRACDRGMRWYNLSSSSGIAGVERFKDGLGARRIPYTTITLKQGAFAAFQKLRSIFTLKQPVKPAGTG